MTLRLPLRAIRALCLWLLGPAALACGAAAVPDRAACDAGWQTLLQPAAAPAQPVDARAVWLDRQRMRWPQAETGGHYRLHHSARAQIVAAPGVPVAGADGALALAVQRGALAPALAQRFRWVGHGLTLAVAPADVARLPALLRGQLVLVQEDQAGNVVQATGVQVAGALDDLYAAAADGPALGVSVGRGRTGFRVWAPTAQAVSLCLHADASAPATAVLPLRRDERTGTWSATRNQALRGHFYTYLVDVVVPGVGLVRNRVTDPYAASLSTDSRRTWIGRLDDAQTKPPGWDAAPRPRPPASATDLVIYELHVRDFSVGDASVRPDWRGKYLGFAEPASDGVKHLRAMAAAGLTDVHLLPVFDLATVPERGCTTPDPARLAALPADSGQQQALVMASAAGDCFNWGYDPLHYTAPEGSFATDPDDGALRLREFRRMVMALHALGLRVGMDVVYNHTSASGQHERSVLDRIVPGYYQRLNAEGRVETSTCCDNTATENRMMARLMIDSAVTWVRAHRIDSFRFDLMGHQPREAMERLQRAVNAAAGRHVHLIGEGWDFGEVAGGARFVQASQRGLPGSGIATFSDRGRDAARGGGCCDNPQQTVQRQGWLNGQFHDPNPHAQGAAAATREDLLRSADLVRVGLAATLADYRMQTHDGGEKTLAAVDYAGQGAGYASAPGEVVNYVENHDNPTLFDINVLKLPPATGREDRARVQVLGIALTALSQGIAYYHAGIEALRSKSLDRNSYDSGDWFNRLDWTFSDNFFGSGLPPKGENGSAWPLMQPLLADPAIKPTAAEIRFTRDAFLDWLRIRAGTTLLRLRTADAVQQRLRFLNTGPAQSGTLIAAHLDGRGLAGAGFAELLYAVNVGKAAETLSLPALQGRRFVLHPVHRAAAAADRRAATEAAWDAAAATLRVPARTAVVWVVE